MKKIINRTEVKRLQKYTVPVKALKGMYRVIKPGGRAVVAIWGERRNCGWADLFPIVDAHVASDVCPMFFRSVEAIVKSSVNGFGLMAKQFHNVNFSAIRPATEISSVGNIHMAGQIPCPVLH